MSNVYELPDRDVINDEASQWLAKLDRGLSTDERLELQQWLASDEHRQVLFNMAEVWDKMECLSLLSVVFPLLA